MPNPFDPYIHPKTGKHWLDPHSAERNSRTVSHGTWKTWADKARTSFGLHLETNRIPLFRTSNSRPKSNRQFRLVIAEDSVNAVQAIFDEVFGDKRERRIHAFNKRELAALESATRRFERKRQPAPTVS